MNFIYGITGVLFGIILTKSEVVSWFRIEKMFRFQEAHMYLVIASAIAVGAFSVAILKKLQLRSLQREKLNFAGKTETKGFVIGGFLFGIGWAITGACPGPIFSQIGAGVWPALVTLSGALCGVYLYSTVRSKLPH